MTQIRARATIRTTEPTRYEVVLEHAGTSEVLGYTARTGSRGLSGYLQSNVERVIAMVPAGSRVFKGGAGTRAALTVGGVTIRFSGRTEREAAL